MKVLDKQDIHFVSGATTKWLEVNDSTISTRCSNFIEDSFNTIFDMLLSGEDTEASTRFAFRMFYAPSSPCTAAEVDRGIDAIHWLI